MAELQPSMTASCCSRWRLRRTTILDTIAWLHQAGVWLEVATLLITGFNDGEQELRELTAFLASVSPDIPWHVTAFHKDYKMTGPPNTTPAMLLRAAAIAREAGLRHVYAGNLPGRVQDFEQRRETVRMAIVWCG